MSAADVLPTAMLHEQPAPVDGPRAAAPLGSVAASDSEPLFNYTRLVSTSALSATPGAPGAAVITDIAVSHKFYALASSTGGVHIFDLNNPSVEWRRIGCHAPGARVNHVHVDEAAEYIVTAGEDATVCIAAVSTDERTSHPHHKAVRGVQIAPDFARSRERPFCTAGVTGKVWMQRKGWFGNSVEQRIHDGEADAPIHLGGIAWCGPMLAWATDKHVFVYDVAREQGVYRADDPTPAVAGAAVTLRGEICPTRLVWTPTETLLIAWGSTLREMMFPERPVEQHGGGPGVVTSAPVVSPPSASAGSSSQPGPDVTLRRQFEQVCTISVVDGGLLCGVTPFGDDLALLVWYASSPDGETGGEDVASSACVELQIVMRSGHLLYRDELPLRNVHELSPGDLHLACDVYDVTGNDGLPLLFIASSSEVIVAQVRGPGDHIEWEVDAGHYETAVALLTANPDALPPARVKALSETYIQSLVTAKAFERAAAACALLYSKDAPECERWLRTVFDTRNADGMHVFAYAALWRFGAARIFQTASDDDAAVATASAPAHVWPTLSMDAYALILDDLLRNQKQAFVRALRALMQASAKALRDDQSSDAHLVDPKRMASTVQSALLKTRQQAGATSDTVTLQQLARDEAYLVDGLVELYLCNSRYADAIRLYMDAHASLATGSRVTSDETKRLLDRAADKVFKLISTYDLHSLVRDRIPDLVAIDEEGTLRMLSEKTEEFPVESVVSQLQARPATLLTYLHNQFTEHYAEYNTVSFKTYHDMQLRLYASYRPGDLMTFLRKSSFCPMDVARDVCMGAKPEPLYRELVFVYTRMGNAREAMSIMLDRLRDVEGAVSIAASFGDEDLWTELVKRVIATRSGEAVGNLLDSIVNTPLSPLRVIMQVPSAVAIPRLQARLLAMLRDKLLHRSMVDTCCGLVQRDLVSLIQLHGSRQRAPVLVSADAACALCQASLAVARAPTARALKEDSDPSAEPASGTPAPAPAPTDETADDAGAPTASAVEKEVPRAAVFFCRHVFHEVCVREYHTQAVAAAAAAAASARRRTRSRSGSITADTRRRRGSSFSQSPGVDAFKPGSFGATPGSTLLGRGASVRGAVPRTPSAALAGAHRASSGALSAMAGDDSDDAAAPTSSQALHLRCPLCYGNASAVDTGATAV